MVKEELRLGECSSHPASSKNAKDKSNSSTLRAMRETKDSDDCSDPGSRCSSEKDSGYSDNGSDWHQTNVTQQRNKRQTREVGDVTESGQSQDGGKGKPGNPKRMPRGQTIQPIYILNNIALKQPETIQKSGQLLWTNGSSEAIASGSTHMILFQQPSFMPAATLQLHKPSSLKNSTTGKKVTTYLPILNSYPRIAPHPSKKPPDKSFLSDEAWILSKRVCTEYKGDLKPVSRSQELAVFTLEQSTSSTSSSSPTQETPNSAPCSPSTSVLTSKGSQRSSNTRHRRFLNTAEILRQSGLLDITLRTKELLGQSNTTEREIAELRQHTELLCQATSSGLSGGAAWQNVHRTMAESNCYPDLKNLKYLQSLSHLESAGQSAGAGKEAALSSDSTPKQNRACAEPHKEFTSSDTYPEEVAFMPPDSSTAA
ncbi:CLOCK-interacting pacemaker [Phyllopteryx taeniolatus]|uniref:CLOCK-interacting pacemaker n=1 Tax=Phyllopteryx taeniolatus TaxID=161469 RepID=UPI002AD41891|nr:CLOCK-interacting pacemaker [Phyllopteryx taeniolatus]